MEAKTISDLFRKIKISAYLEYDEISVEHIGSHTSRSENSKTMFLIGYIIVPTDVAERVISLDHFENNIELKEYLDDVLGLSDNEDYPSYRTIYSLLDVARLHKIPRGKATNTFYVTQVAGSAIGRLRPNRTSGPERSKNAYYNRSLASKIFTVNGEDNSNDKY